MASRMIKEKKDYDKLPIVGTIPKNSAEEKYLKEIIKCEFYNLEQPGVAQQFVYGNTSALKKFIFFHGGKYEIPRHVAKWVESRGTPLYEWIPGGDGKLKKEFRGWNPRFSMRILH